MGIFSVLITYAGQRKQLRKSTKALMEFGLKLKKHQKRSFEYLKHLSFLSSLGSFLMVLDFLNPINDQFTALLNIWLGSIFM